MADRVGICWRPELAAGILTNLDRIDVLEVIADDYFDSAPKAQALRTLAAQRPVLLHAVSFGLASTAPADSKRLAKIARLAAKVRPESWSEHLAFVRAGKVEIGHLAAPPRTETIVDATAENLHESRRIVGALPRVENIATLIDPPASNLDEPEWLTRTLVASGAELLLDLHNLYANSLNFGADPFDFLARLPLDRVREVHISGGKWIPAGPDAKRLLDDHLHDPPGPVFDLLERLAGLCPNPLTVILERDGSFPPITHILAQLDRARQAIAAGRTTALHGTSSSRDQIGKPAARPNPYTCQSISEIEHLLAHVYTNEAARAEFIANPRPPLESIDLTGLQLAAASFARKRTAKQRN